MPFVCCGWQRSTEDRSGAIKLMLPHGVVPCLIFIPVNFKFRRSFRLLGTIKIMHISCRGRLNINMPSYQYVGILIIKIRRSNHRLFFIMEIPFFMMEYTAFILRRSPAPDTNLHHSCQPLDKRPCSTWVIGHGAPPTSTLPCQIQENCRLKLIPLVSKGCFPYKYLRLTQ